MASIKKRKNKYVVIYYYKENGQGKRRWETFDTFAEAKAKKNEIEIEQSKNTFITPKDTTISEFMDQFVELYGTKNWSLNTFVTNTDLIKHYVVPYIGNIKLQELNSFAIENYYNRLAKEKQVASNKPITNSIIQRVHRLMKTAYKNAVLWDLAYANPFEKVQPPKHVKEERAIWTSDQIATALKACDDQKLALAIHLAFACSLRLGEILGLTWENVHIDEESILNDDAYIYIDKQLESTNAEALERLNKKDVMKVFPFNPETKRRVVLKTPKTQSSVRKVWLPNTLAVLLTKWKAQQERYKEFLKDDYHDYDLVVCFEDGRPCSTHTIEEAFKRLIEKSGLPKVVFHSLRHSSTTYKLKLNHGDIKATQGDTGHSQADMVMEVYSHILDEDRKVNAQKMNESFYTGKETIDYRTRADIDKLIESIKDDPELIKVLAEALKE